MWLVYTHTNTQLFHGSMDLGSKSFMVLWILSHSHLSWSSIAPYMLHPSNTIYGILPVHSTHLTIFFPQSVSKFCLVYLLAWHPPLHTPHISSPNHCLLFATHAHTICSLFCCSTTIMSSDPSLSLNPLHKNFWADLYKKVLTKVCTFLPYLHLLQTRYK